MSRRNVIAALSVCTLLVFSPLEVNAMQESEVEELTAVIGGDYGICPEFLQAMAWKESNYQEDAINEGCVGLMQVSARWHRDRMGRLGVRDLYDPAENMKVAADYLKELFEQYEDPGMVLMVYNGDSRAEDYWRTGEGLSDYAQDILELSAELERKHGK